MCTVNDTIRKDYTDKIEELNKELETEISKQEDIDKASGEMEKLKEKAECVINNISECNFSGDVILSSIKTSNQGYINRIDFYSKYKIECQNAIEQINQEIKELTAYRDNLPENCGDCNECKPNSNPNASGEESQT